MVLHTKPQLGSTQETSLFLWGDLLGESLSAQYLRPRLGGLREFFTLEIRHFWPRTEDEPKDGTPIPLSGGRPDWTVRSRISARERTLIESLAAQSVPLGSPVLAVAPRDRDPTPLIHADIPQAGRIFLVDPSAFPHDGHALATQILQLLAQEGQPSFALNLVIARPDEGGTPGLIEEGRRFQKLLGRKHDRLAHPPLGKVPRMDLHFVTPEHFRPAPGADLSVLRLLDPSLAHSSKAIEALHRADQIWVPSGFGRRILEKQGIHPSKIHCLPPPLPPSQHWDSPLLGDTHPLTLIEAMARGRPPRVSPRGTPQDLVEHEGNARLIPGRCLQMGAGETTWISPTGPSLDRAHGAQAARHARRHFAPERVRELALAAIKQGLDHRPCPSSPLIRFEGPLFESSSYGRITRSFARALRRQCPDVPLELCSRLDAIADTSRDTDLLPLCVPSGRRPSHSIRSGWPISHRVPDHGQWILRFDWEFGPPPLSLAGLFSGPSGSPHAPDQIWVHSQYVRNNLLAAGIPPERLRLVPHGIDPQVFRPAGSTATNPKTTFLFVGGFTKRKGLDLLLGAWRLAFDPHDPVRLLLKASPTAAYTGNPMAVLAQQAARDPSLAEVSILHDDLDDRQMAALYQEADLLVHPYRGEGFGMPILEAMACGTPVITTAGGASEDFVQDIGSITISAKRVPCRIQEPCAGAPFWLEPEIEELAGALTLAANCQSQLKKEALEVSERIHRSHSWDAVVRQSLPFLGLSPQLGA
ncbi:MAG TPA: glycosyltransferase [Planctomycetes bacterium]|nr:glycosyltransferase [Planctomycetota bacterium]